MGTTYIAKINYDNLVAKTDHIKKELKEDIESVKSAIKENAKVISDFVDMTTDPVCIIYDKTGGKVTNYYVGTDVHRKHNVDMYLTSGGTSVIPEKYLSKSIVTTKYYINGQLVHTQTNRLSDLDQDAMILRDGDAPLARIFEIPIADIPYKDNFKAPTLLILYEYSGFNNVHYMTDTKFPSNGVYLGSTVYDVPDNVELTSYTTYIVEVSCINIEGVYNVDKQISNTSVEGFSELKSNVATLQTRSRNLQSAIGDLNTNVESLMNDMFTILSSGITEGTVVTVERSGETFKNSGITYTYCSEKVPSNDELNSSIIRATRVEIYDPNLNPPTIMYPVFSLYMETFRDLGEIYARVIHIPIVDYEDINEVFVLLIHNASIFNRLNEQLEGRMKNGIYICDKKANPTTAGGVFANDIKSFEYRKNGVPYAKVNDGLLLDNSEFKALLARVAALEEKHQ